MEGSIELLFRGHIEDEISVKTTTLEGITFDKHLQLVQNRQQEAGGNSMPTSFCHFVMGLGSTAMQA